MKRSFTFDLAALLKGTSAVALAAAVLVISAADADAQRRNNNNDDEAEQNRTVSTEVGETILEVTELQEQEQWGQVLQLLNRLINEEELTPYERSIVLQLRGRSNYATDDISAAIRDWLCAIDTGALVPDEVNNLRVNIGQLYMAQDNIPEGIRQIELALANGAEQTTAISQRLAQAYAQLEDFDGGLRYAERFYNEKQSKTSGDYALMQYYYQQLNRPQDELRVVRARVAAYPGERSPWQSLVSLFARLERESEAFEANKLMYLNGLFEEEDELLRLAQYYSFFNNPYRGASILEREINAGRVEADIENLELLANMWRQAQEFERAIPVLERLSRVSGDGENALKLAEALYQLNRYGDAEAAFETALERGGLGSDAGNAWNLLGLSRFEQDDRQGALAAFRQGAEFSGSARVTARGYIEFINGQIDSERRRANLREQVLIDECRLTLEAERNLLVLTGEVDEDGRVRFETIPDRCQRYFNIYGEQIREAGMSDEEAEAMRQRVEQAARQAAENARNNEG
jgi:tetratricopeptide (TPR) repeat protein